MLRIYTQRSAAAAKSYYDDALRLGDYYAEGQEIAGWWGGKAAGRLGLSGVVSREVFHALCDNYHPVTGAQLTARMNTDRRVGYDFNFNAPKKLSVLYALTRDERILDAFRRSVRETMQDLEREVACRVRDHGQDGERTTGNLAYAGFVHLTARPVDGVPDPALHAHCVVFNATWDAEHARRDGTSGMWKAVDVARIKADGRYWEAAFHARLSGRIARMGYRVARDGNGFWDIALPDSIRDRFSRRTRQIEEAAQEKGILDPKARAGLAATTRDGKSKHLSMAELRPLWNGWLTADEHAAMTSARQKADGTDRRPEVAVAACLDYGIQRSFERASVVPARHLEEQTLRRGFGAVAVHEAAAAVRDGVSNGALLSAGIDGRRMVTTREVLLEERAMVATARAGRGVCAPLAPAGYQLQDALFHDPTKDTEEQAEVVRHVLTSRDQVIAVAGAAGTGKTTVMQEIARGIEAGGRRLHAFAPGSEASRGVLRREGFDDATTVAALLRDPQLQEAIRGQVILVDEAGTMGAQDMNAVLQLARRQDARVILSGDVHQHMPVARGDALRVLERWGGVAPARLTRIQRQRRHPAYRDAVAAAAQGDTLGAFTRLQAMHAVHEFADDRAEERHRELASAYVRLSGETTAKGKPKEVLVVAPTHAEGQAVTSHIRAALREAGRIGEEDREHLRLRNLGWTVAEKADAVSYRAGLVVQFHQNTPGGFRAGSRYRVIEQANDAVQLEDEHGSAGRLPREAAERFDVFEPGSIGLTVGDTIRMTRGAFTADRMHRLNNGAVFTVAGFSPEGHVRLHNGWEVAADCGHFTHGYTSTSHASQGRTVDAVLLAMGSESAGAASLEGFYVAASRGRAEVQVYTDDVDALQRVIQRSSMRMAALEVEAKQAEQRHWQRCHQQRRDRIRSRRREIYERRRDEHTLGRARQR